MDLAWDSEKNIIGPQPVGSVWRF